MKQAGVILFATVFGAMSVRGADIHWNGASGGRWSAAANWQGGVAPGAADTAVFALTNDMRVVLDASAGVANVSVTGARLDLFSRMGAVLSLDGDTPEIAVGAGAKLRVSGVRLGGSAQIRKTGLGKLTVVGRTAAEIDLNQAEGELELEDTRGKTVTVSANDGLWKYAGVTSDGAAVVNTPYGGTNGVYVGNNSSMMVTVTARREPIKINGRVRITGDVRMEGSGSWGFATVIHNDPRGFLAHADCQRTAALGYDATDEKGAVRKSFAFGLVNHYEYDGRVMWGWNGKWRNPGTQGGVVTDPFIYFSPCGASSATDKHSRDFKLQLEFDSFAKTAVITIIQDQSAIVESGGTAVTWTKTLTGIDLTSLCEGDTATLAFTTDAGGRNTKAFISNLKVEYPEPTAGIRDCVTVVSSENLWTNLTVTAAGVESVKSPYGTQEGSVRAGADAGSAGSVTARREKINVRGKIRISGKVSDSGNGSHGWALVLHNDPRGPLARAVVKQGAGMLFDSDAKIENSYAFRVLNYYDLRGQVGDGANGVWNGTRVTSPLILTNPYDDSTTVRSTAKYDFTALFDEQTGTMTLTLTQEQTGGTVTATETFTGVSLPTLVGDDCAWISLTSDAGGRTTNATIDDFTVTYLADEGETSDSAFFRALEASGTNAVITATRGDGDFVAGLGSLTVGRNGLQLGARRASVTVETGRWAQRCVNSEGSEWDGPVYGAKSGSIRVGAGTGYAGSVTACQDPVYVGGKFRVSGSVTDAGSGSHGFGIVFHNDARGPMARGTTYDGASANFMYSTGDGVKNSYLVGFPNYVSMAGRVMDGVNGTLRNSALTSPLIRTNPFDGTTLKAVQWSFVLDYDQTAKSVTIVLSQVQDDRLVSATNVFWDVDLPLVCGANEAWLSFMSNAGGRSTDVTVDDLRIDYPFDTNEQTTFACTGTVTAAVGAKLRLGGATFRVTNADQLFGFDSLRLDDVSRLDVGADLDAKVRALYRDGTRLRLGTYTADTCSWVSGAGAVTIWGSGTVIIVR